MSVGAMTGLGLRTPRWRVGLLTAGLPLVLLAGLAWTRHLGEAVAAGAGARRVAALPAVPFLEVLALGYRESMAEFSEMKTLELWYRSLGADELVATIKDQAFRERAVKRLQETYAQYSQFGLWTEMAALFSDNAELSYGKDAARGRAAIQNYFLTKFGEGTPGLKPGGVHTQMVLRPLIKTLIGPTVQQVAVLPRNVAAGCEKE